MYIVDLSYADVSIIPYNYAKYMYMYICVHVHVYTCTCTYNVYVQFDLCIEWYVHMYSPKAREIHVHTCII